MTANGAPGSPGKKKRPAAADAAGMTISRPAGQSKAYCDAYVSKYAASRADGYDHVRALDHAQDAGRRADAKAA